MLEQDMYYSGFVAAAFYFQKPLLVFKKVASLSLTEKDL